jgi:hypothetical protein
MLQEEKGGTKARQVGEKAGTAEERATDTSQGISSTIDSAKEVTKDKRACEAWNTTASRIGPHHWQP